MRQGSDLSAYYKKKAELEQKAEPGHCIVCGKKLPKYKRKYCSDACRYELLAEIKSWPIIRREALKRDNYTCQDCGYKAPSIGWLQSTTGLEVHHIIPIHAGGDEFDLKNLITLCHDCHVQRHKRINASKRNIGNMSISEANKLQQNHQQKLKV
jgi:5-methylcytosine-specific restriction endonuclease McrA